MTMSAAERIPQHAGLAPADGSLHQRVSHATHDGNAAEVARMLRDAGADRSARKVDTAWLAVLAGDVDDVREHVAQEESARGE